ncbi:DEAD/DEAH box helicase [Maribellus sp. CM-23]|uniref:DEAD/DEAH box helicase n=1 Tax=Maribellus sp. CM-23 TaxID=2781026 RepID=UPI001F1A9CB2|nr:DEAD/DEAH box helicase [Maribellus sp. CM-23]MCE4566921.1 DEAD/DEAH box helicase [Maribellus sp. CM-23]
MKLKKIIPELAQSIIEAGFDTNPREIQSSCISKIKSGADLLVISPEDSGKSTTIVIGIIQQLKKAYEEAPRAIVMVSDRDKAFELEEQFKLMGSKTNLRIFTVFDKGDIQYQKDMIYEGLDILIGTPIRINELLSITGIPTTALKILAIDDAEMIFPGKYHTVVYRIAERTKKLQFLFFANKWHEKFEDLTERILKNPVIIRKD